MSDGSDAIHNRSYPTVVGPHAIMGSMRDRDVDSGGEKAAPSCPACGSPLTVPIPIDDPDDVYLRCEACGSAAAIPLGVRPAVMSYYRHQSNLSIHVDIGATRERREHWRRWLALAGKPREGRFLLDVGCGSGAFLTFAASEGWLAVGCDPAEEAIKHARERGLDARLGTVEALGLPRESVDLVTAWDVLEHTADPVGLLSVISQILRPGGRLLVEVPDEGFFGRRLATWLAMATRNVVDARPFLYHPDHRVYLTRDGVRLALSRAGLAPLLWGSAGSSPTLIREKARVFHPRWPRFGLVLAARGIGGLAPMGLGNKLVFVAGRS